MLADPPARAEAQDDVAHEPAGRREIDVLETGRIPELRLPQALREAPLLTRGPFRVDQQAEAIFKRQFRVLARAALLVERLGHRRQMQGLEFFNRRVCQHTPPRSRWRRARSRASAADGQGARRAGAGPAEM